MEYQTERMQTFQTGKAGDGSVRIWTMIITCRMAKGGRAGGDPGGGEPYAGGMYGWWKIM